MIPGYTFSNPALCEEALTHPSWANERPGVRHYERLEFLGDAVAQLVVTELLMGAFPDWREGKLTPARARLVSEAGLAPISVELGLPALLRHPPGTSDIIGQSLVQSRVFEAVLGAIYMDGGLDAARAWARPLFQARVARAAELPRRDAKSMLQEWCQARKLELPAYSEARSGPAHRLQFLVTVTLGDGRAARGEGRSKKEAEIAAAATMLSLIEAAATPVSPSRRRRSRQSPGR